MNRRDFLAGVPFTGYSLIVQADQLPPAQGPLPSVEEIRRQMDRLSPPASARRRSTQEPNLPVVDLAADFVVAGGGLAGVAAAIAAARHGAKVILLNDRSVLGGNSSSDVKMHVCGSHAIPGWRETGLMEELRIEDAVRNPQRSFEMWDLLLYDKVISERNITLLLDTTLYGARTANGRITEVMARCDRAEALYRIQGKYFCDATGDCRLGLEAGAEMRQGRESRGEFGDAPHWARKITKEQLKFRRITEWDYGYWWIAWGGNRDIIRDHERIRFELLSIVLGVWDYIKNSGEHPESEYWALEWVGMLPGKRESRRMVGDHILTQQDCERGDIEDAVAIGGWPFDDHPPEGFDRPDLPPNKAVRFMQPYNIPLRSLYSRNVANLFLAGRNMSCTHVAFSSTRVMATLGAAGQAVGAAAAMCAAQNVTPRELAGDRQKLAALQQRLLRDDQTIMKRVNEDPLDLARTARVSASAEEPGAPARNVIDGHLRDHYRDGKRTEVHQWSAPLTGEGAWIELTWDRPQRIRHVQITFDTGLERRLMLSASESVSRGQIRDYHNYQG
ncbi:MAG: FAD-dependent oxidoreductase, partial [Bryobacter sp.]|nr:FAD-dependent oxidoreductase [Bryobacter sp.]